MLYEEINIIADSSGGVNVSSDGSIFELNFSPAISIPTQARNVTVSCEGATIWWTVPNIITGENSTFYIDAPRASDDATTSYVVELPSGLYNLSQLESAILNDLENQGSKVSPEPVLNFIADEATSKVIIRLNYAACSVDFTQVGTPREILGFNSQVIAGAVLNNLAPNIAAFNTVNSFLLHTDLVSSGMRLNSSFSQVVAQVLIDTSPGSQIVYSPFHPVKSSEPWLAGSSLNRLRFWLTDHLNRAVNTNGETFSMRLVIRYTLQQ